MRQRVARASLIVATLLLAWACLLALSGGFDITLFGWLIRSHNPRRPAQWGLVVLALFVAAHGVRRTWGELTVKARTVNAWLTVVELPYGLLALALTLWMLLYSWHFTTFVAGGSDSYGYLSQAEFWLRGVPIVPQPLGAEVPWPHAMWTLSPLGYRFVPGTTSIVPTYAVGLPLILAAVQWLAGFTAMFWVWPVAAATFVYATYLIGRELGSPAVGLIAAWLLATNHTVFIESAAPASDVPVSAALAVTCYFLLRARGPAPIRAGLAASIGVMIRPNLAGTVAALGLWLAVQPALGGRVSWGSAIRGALTFALAAAPGFLIVALANRALFGSPFVSGYGSLSHIFLLKNVPINLHNYPALILETGAGLLFVGMIAICLQLRALWRGVEDRSVFPIVMVFVGSVLVQFLLFEPAVNAGYLRYIMPTWPLLFVGVAHVLRLPARPGWRAAAVGVVILLIGARIWPLVVAANPRSENKYPQAGVIVRDRVEPNSVVFTMQHSGSVRYYSGLTTIRYDILDHDWLDRAVTWLQNRGLHAYAVLDNWEVPLFRQRFASQARVAALDHPAYVYANHGIGYTYVYDLSAPLEDRPPTITVDESFAGPRIVRPTAPRPLPGPR